MAQGHAMQTTAVGAGQTGWVLANEVRDHAGGLLLPKGTILDSASLDRLRDAESGELHLIELAANELHEDEAGRRVAAVVTGSGLRIDGPMQSRYDLIAESRGLVRVDAGLVRAINRVEGVTVYTMLDWQPVVAGTAIASVKISPIAIPESQIVTVERLCREALGPALQILPFQPKRVAVLTTEPLDTEQQARFQAAMERKVTWYGATLTDLRVVEPTAEAVAETIGTFLRDGNEIILSGGGNPIDPLDPIDLALPLIDARIVHRGAPTRGSMFWLAQAGDVPIVNVASVRMLSGVTAADAFLPMLMAGHSVTRDDILDIGVGGLPGSAIRFRFPSYDVDEQN